jgi:hypothetical protein
VSAVTILVAQRRLDYLSRDPAPTMGQVEVLGSGGLRIPATFTRIGVFQYWDEIEKRWIGELRPPEEVFAAASLATLPGLPLTDLHPPQAVTLALWPAVARGHVEDCHVDGIHVRGHVVVAHPDLCKLIQGGERSELSGGYTADCEIASGTWQGVPYERIQRNIRYDHVACGPKDWARGGPTVRLALDGGFVPSLTGGPRGRLETHYRADSRAGATSMSLKFLRDQRAVEVGGKKYDLTKTDEVKAAQDAARTEVRRVDGLDPAQAAAVIDEVRGQLDVANQTLVALAAELVGGDVALEQATSPEQLDAMTEERADCIAKARVLAPEVETKGKTLEQIRRAVLTARGVKHDGESADYVRGAFNREPQAVTFTREDTGAIGAKSATAGTAADAKTGNALTNAWKNQSPRGRA